MQRGVLRLVGALSTLLWAQTAGVWHWHQHANTGQARPAQGWEKPDLYRSIPGKVVVAGDTVYVLGTIHFPDDGDNLLLPGMPCLFNQSSDHIYAAYVAAYQRTDGAFLWMSLFYGDEDDAKVGGTDLVVDSASTQPDTLYLLLVAYSPSQSATLYFYTCSSGSSSTISPLSSTTIEANYQQSFILKFPARATNSGDFTIQHLKRGVNPSGGSPPFFQANFFHLLLHSGKLWASGTVVTRQNFGGSSYLLPSLLSPYLTTTGLQDLFESPPSLGKNYIQATLLRMDPTTLRVDSVAVVQGQSTTASSACYGRALFAYNTDTLGWLVANPENNLIRYRVVTGTASSLPFRSLNLLLIRGSTLRLHSTLQLAQYPNISNPPTPPPYYVAFHHYSSPGGGELHWAVADTGSYTILPGATSYPGQPPNPRLLLVKQVILPNGTLSSGPAVKESTPLPQLQLSGLVFDPAPTRPYLYLSGTLAGTSWTVLERTLPASHIGNAPVGFVLGYARATQKFLGYKRIYSLGPSGNDTVFTAGVGVHPTHPQLYLYGWARDSLLVEPRWSDGRSDTVRLTSNPGDPARIWVGRLDLYQLSKNYVYSGTCAPDTLASPPNISVTGTWDASILRELVWVPVDPSRAYQGPHSWAVIRADSYPEASSFTEGVSSYSPSRLLVPGRLPPGEYFLALRSPLLGKHFADIGPGDTLKLQVSGTTTSELGRAGALRHHRLTRRFAGGTIANTTGEAHTATSPFYRKERRFTNIRSLAYAPWSTQDTNFAQEVVYIIDLGSSSYYLYSLSLNSGQVTRLRSWLASGSTNRGAEIIYDPVRGALWSHRAIQRSNYTVLYRIHPTDPAKDDSIVFYQGGTTPTSIPAGYPFRTPWRWMHLPSLNPSPFTCTSKGDLVGIVWHRRLGGSPFRYSLHLARVASERDSTLLVAGQDTVNPNCPLDGIGSAARLSHIFSSPTSDGDTIYWIEQIPTNCSPAGDRYILRRAWPTTPERRAYEVKTLDTFPANWQVDRPTFAQAPQRGLYLTASRTFPSKNFFLWYDLSSRSVDTLLQCADPLFFSQCCEYDLSDYVSYSKGPYVVLRGGAILYSGTSSGEIRIALPVLTSGMRDTLRAEEFISDAVGGSASADSLYLNPAPDSTRLAVRTCGNTSEKDFWYGSYTITVGPPAELVAPDTVCEGMQFSSFVRRPSFPQEEDCAVGLRLYQVTSRQGLVSAFSSSGNEAQHWKAHTAGYDTLEVGLTRSRWSWLTQGTEHPLRIRRGHRVRLRAALEGPWVGNNPSSPHWMRRDTFLTRARLVGYNALLYPISSDSLWGLPRPTGDSLPKVWTIFLTEPILGCSNPSSNPSICSQNWTAIARIEVYDATSSARVDSAYALIDTMGRLYFYRAPLGWGGFFNADTLHFCHCDPNAAKYFVLRTPNHLPLYTVPLTLLAREVGAADSLDLTDPSTLQGVPGLHYTLLEDNTFTPPRMRAGAWAGNCADLFNGFVAGPHYDSGIINAADLEFLLPRNGITTGFSWADLDSDGDVDAADGVLLIQNQNALRQSAGP